MITLNLIPPSKKKELLLTQLYVGIKNLIIFILLISIIVAILLLSTKAILENYFGKIIEETTLVTKYANTFNQDIRQFNGEINALAKIQDDHIDWLVFLADLSEITPSDVAVNHVGIEKNKILINGTAKTRSVLLEFRDALAHSEVFTDVDLPLEYQLKREDIEFSIKATLDPKPLKLYAN